MKEPTLFKITYIEEQNQGMYHVRNKKHDEIEADCLLDAIMVFKDKIGDAKDRITFISVGSKETGFTI